MNTKVYVIALINIQTRVNFIDRVVLSSSPAGSYVIDFNKHRSVDLFQAEGANYGEALANVRKMIESPYYGWAKPHLSE